MKLKFLLDENLSPKTKDFLLDLGLEAFDASDFGLRGKSDEDIYEYAREKKLFLITYDHEFGYLYHSRKDLQGLILLKVHPQTFEVLHPVLKRFFEIVEKRKIDLKDRVPVIEKSRFRIKRIR